MRMADVLTEVFLTKSSNVVKLDRMSIVLQGPVTIEKVPDQIPQASTSAGQDTDVSDSVWKIKLGDHSSVSVYAVNDSSSPAEAPPQTSSLVSGHAAAILSLMQLYWQNMTNTPAMDFASITWPGGLIPRLGYCAWKSASDGGVDRTPNANLGDIASGNGNQLIVLENNGTSVTSPWNWVPQDRGAVFIIGCADFIQNHVQYAIDNAFPADQRLDNFDKFYRNHVPTPSWPPAQWTQATQPTAQQLATLNFHDQRSQETNNKPSGPGVDIQTNATFACTKGNTITFSGTIASSQATITPGVDLAIAGVGNDGRLSFSVTGDWIEVPSTGDQSQIWMDDAMQQTITRFSGYNLFAVPQSISTRPLSVC